VPQEHQPWGLVHLVGVEGVEGARGPGSHRVDAQPECQSAKAEGRQQGSQGDGHVVREDRIPRGPVDGCHGERGEQLVVAEGERVVVRVERGGVRPVPRVVETGSPDPTHEVDAVQRVADVPDGVVGAKGLGVEADGDQDRV
jgi:hypothetical protein